MPDEVTQVVKNLGLVTAYGYAKAGGYTGTEEQFKTAAAVMGYRSWGCKESDRTEPLTLSLSNNVKAYK